MCKSGPFKLFPFTEVLENMNQDNIDYDTSQGGLR